MSRPTPAPKREFAQRTPNGGGAAASTRTPNGPPQADHDHERWLQSLDLFGMRFGLDRMRRLLTGREWRARVVHVVGTNGKTSTTRMTDALLRHHGLRTGAYLSPHLRSLSERILEDGEDIGAARFAREVARVRGDVARVERTLGADDRVTQFEALTYAALSTFMEDGMEAVVLEAGLGGRFDATNVLEAEVVVLTNVGLEHTRWLGPTVADIAREKLAVVGAGTRTLVCGPDLHPDALAEAAAVCERHAVRLVHAPTEPTVPVDLRARGGFQRRNFAVAEAAAAAFLGALDPVAVRAAAAATAVPGRFEVVAGDPEVILDGAHNPAGIGVLVDALADHRDGRALVAVVSVLDDKDAGEMLRALLGACDRVVLTSTSNPRALSPATLESLSRQIAPAVRTEVVVDPRAALDRARTHASRARPPGLVVATGSIYLVGDLTGPS